VLPADGRWEQVISPEVARAKGVCQCCLMDMEFNLPVGVRDALLKGSAEEQALLPQSGVNQTYFYDQVRTHVLAAGRVSMRPSFIRTKAHAWENRCKSERMLARHSCW